VRKDSESPQRLDQEVAARQAGISRRQARELIAQRRVLVDGHLVAVASRLVSAGQSITVFPTLPDLSILALNKDWLAIDKPSGVPSQPVRERDRPSILEITAVVLASRAEPANLYPVHRLDSGTSGVMVIARTPEMARRLSLLFAGSEVKKEYTALLAGLITTELIVDAPIGRQGADRFGVRPDGRSAITRFRPLTHGHSATAVTAEITHGRTHQVRVHASHAGHPLVGDRKYGGPPAPRLMLHAWTLSHPDLGRLIAPLPEQFLEIAKEWGIGAWPAPEP
jgi:23S rRNA pseudouridine1911/1915/1917 synthase